MRYVTLPSARIFALVFCVSVVLGGSLPDVGNIAVYQYFPHLPEHYFNIHFLVVGVLGILISVIALVRR